VAVLLFTFLTPATSNAAPVPVVFTWGDYISHLGEVTNENKALLELSTRAAGRSTVMTHVGYEYSYAGIFWVSFFNWGGTYCLYQDTHYVKITKEQAAALMGKKSVSAPFLYRVPMGWLLIGVPVGLLMAAAGISNALENARIRRLEKDARYQRALEIVRTSMTALMARQTVERQTYDQLSRGIHSTTHPRGVAGVWVVAPDTSVDREWLDDLEHGIAARQIHAPADAVGAQGAIAGSEFRIDGVLQVSDDLIVYQLTNVHTGKFAAYGFNADWCQASSLAAT
jgi:hypothetical protein